MKSLILDQMYREEIPLPECLEEPTKPVGINSERSIVHPCCAEQFDGQRRAEGAYRLPGPRDAGRDKRCDRVGGPGGDCTGRRET